MNCGGCGYVLKEAEKELNSKNFPGVELQARMVFIVSKMAGMTTGEPANTPSKKQLDFPKET